jgi:gas vesicle structural protein
MAVATHGTASGYLQRAPSPSGLADVVDLILDKGLVIDAYIRVAVIGIELITIDARIVIASVDTYLRFAEQVNRLDLTETELSGLPELAEWGTEKMAEQATESAVGTVTDKVTPDSSAARTAVKGVAAAAALGAAAVAAREIASRVGSDAGDEGDAERDEEGGS